MTGPAITHRSNRQPRKFQSGALPLADQRRSVSDVGHLDREPCPPDQWQSACFGVDAWIAFGRMSDQILDPPVGDRETIRIVPTEDPGHQPAKLLVRRPCAATSRPRMACRSFRSAARATTRRCSGKSSCAAGEQAEIVVMPRADLVQLPAAATSRSLANSRNDRQEPVARIFACSLSGSTSWNVGKGHQPLDDRLRASSGAQTAAQGVERGWRLRRWPCRRRTALLAVIDQLVSQRDRVAQAA